MDRDEISSRRRRPGLCRLGCRAALVVALTAAGVGAIDRLSPWVGSAGVIADAAGQAAESPASPGGSAAPGTLEALGNGLQQAAASMLAVSIAQIRDDAILRGVEPLPAEVRRAFAGFLPEALLDRIRWRVESDEFSLPGGVLSLGDRPAMTAGHVIVFANAADIERPLVWAHELHHVSQYAEWGIDGFARRYLADPGAVEHAANEFVWRWRDAGGEIAAAP